MDSITTFITAVTHQGILVAPEGNILCRVVQLVRTLAGEAYTPHSLQQRTARRRSRSTPSALFTLFSGADCSEVKYTAGLLYRGYPFGQPHTRGLTRPASR